MKYESIETIMERSRVFIEKANRESMRFAAENDNIIANGHRWMRFPAKPSLDNAKRELMPRGGKAGYKDKDPEAYYEYQHGPYGDLLSLYEHHAEFNRRTGKITVTHCGPRYLHSRAKEGKKRVCPHPHFFGAEAALEGAKEKKQAFLADASWGETRDERLDAFELYMNGEKLPKSFCVYSVSFPFEVEFCRDRPSCGMKHFARRNQAHAYSTDLQIADILNNVRTENNVTVPMNVPLEQWQIAVEVGRLLKQRGSKVEPYTGELPAGLSLNNINVLSSYLEQASAVEAEGYKRGKSDDAQSGVA